MGTNEKVVRRAQESQRLMKALRVRIRFFCEHQNIQNNGGLVRWALVCLSPKGNPEVASAGLEGQGAVPSYTGVFSSL